MPANLEACRQETRGSRSQLSAPGQALSWTLRSDMYQTWISSASKFKFHDIRKCSNLVYYIVCIFEPMSNVYTSKSVPIDAEKCERDGCRDKNDSLRDVKHCGSLVVTEVASSLAICMRWNGGSEGGIRQMSKSFLSANLSFYTLDSRGGLTAISLSRCRFRSKRER